MAAKKLEKSYDIETLMMAMQQHENGDEITAKCLRCGAQLQVHHNVDAKSWVIRCPNKHFVHYASNPLQRR